MRQIFHGPANAARDRKSKTKAGNHKQQADGADGPQNPSNRCTKHVQRLGNAHGPPRFGLGVCRLRKISLQCRGPCQSGRRAVHGRSPFHRSQRSKPVVVVGNAGNEAALAVDDGDGSLIAELALKQRVKPVGIEANNHRVQRFVSKENRKFDERVKAL